MTSAIKALGPADAASMASLHARAFESPWDAMALSELLSQPGVLGLGRADAAFILCRAVADEAEILTLATAPETRRKGLGQALVEAACEAVATAGATRLFLEVSEDNAAARALYARTGFVEVGRRRRYYARPEGVSVDALVLERRLAAMSGEDFTGHLPSG